MSEANGFANREQLLELFGQPHKRRFATTTVGGTKFRLRSLNDLEASDYDARKLDKNGQLDRKGVATANARIITLCVVDAEGNPVFSETDIPRIGQMDSAFVTELAGECLRHCGTDEVAEKNSPPTQSDDSPTA